MWVVEICVIIRRPIDGESFNADRILSDEDGDHVFEKTCNLRRTFGLS